MSEAKSGEVGFSLGTLVQGERSSANNHGNVALRAGAFSAGGAVATFLSLQQFLKLPLLFCFGFRSSNYGTYGTHGNFCNPANPFILLPFAVLPFAFAVASSQ